MRTVLLILLFLLVSCAQKAPHEADSDYVMRYLAWLQGDVQTNYRANRSEARRRLERYKAKPPTISEREQYLDYVSVLDAVGRSTEAEAKIKELLLADPKEKRALFLLGVHYSRKNKKKLALYFFSKLEKDKRFSWRSLLLNNLGMIALRRGDRNLAIDYFEKATKAKPYVAAPHVNLGALYLQSHSYAEAEKVFSKAHQIDDDFEDAALGLGISLEGQQKYKEAHRIYSKFIASHPKALSLLYNDAILLGNKLNRQSKAAEQLLRYIQRGGKETARAQKFMQNWR